MRRGIITLGLATGLAVSLAACGAGASSSPAASSAASNAASGPTIAVTGSDYKFDGLPADVAKGSVLTFKNAATDEDHLLVVVRRNDDVTRDLEDLLKNGTEDEQQSMTTQVGGQSSISSLTFSSSRSTCSVDSAVGSAGTGCSPASRTR